MFTFLAIVICWALIAIPLGIALGKWLKYLDDAAVQVG